MNTNSANLSSFTRAIGLIYDRTGTGNDPLCSTFLVADKKVATLASLMLPFANHPNALKVKYPVADREYGVSAIHLHPKFDRGFTRKTLFQGTLGNGPEAALQKYNCCVLELTDTIEPVTDQQIEQVSQSLRYPINLADEGFRGSLSEIELPLVIQTLNNAKKQGILYICDDLHRPLAQIFCGSGRVVAAKYRALMNELAMFQIVEKRLTGRFIFRAGKPPVWMTAQTITRTTDTILIEAMRRQDEITTIKKQLGTNDFFFVRAYKQLYLDGMSQESRRYAETIWRALDGTTPADQLWCLVPLDDYTIYSTLQEMYATNQVMRVPLSGTKQFAIPKMPEEGYAPAFVSAVPLPLGVNLPLNAFDTISSVSLDPESSRPRVKVGALLGAIDPYDALHLLHDIPLLPWASGSPLIKDDLVIGMHCGVVPNSSSMDNTTGVLQQMLWCDAIAQVIKEIPGTVLPPPIPMTAPTPLPASPAHAGASAAAASGPGAPGGGDSGNNVDTATRMAAFNSGAAGPPNVVPGAAGSGINLDTATRMAAFNSSGAGAGNVGTGASGSSPGAINAGNPTASYTGMSAMNTSQNQTMSESKKRRLQEPVAPPVPKGPPGCREIASLKCAICGERTFSSARRCTRCANEFVPQLKRSSNMAKLDLAVPVAALLVLAMAASAAYAWARLPQPIFADMDVMAIPAKPWAELSIMKADPQTGKWMKQPNNSKFVPTDVIHFRLKSNRPCYVYLLSKGSGEGKAALAFPTKDSKQLAEGEAITFPEYVTELRDGHTYLKGMSLSGAPGSDKVIAFASSPYELDWLKDVNNVDTAFEKANAALSLASNGAGVLLSENQIMPPASGSDAKPRGSTVSEGREMVFVTSVVATH